MWTPSVLQEGQDIVDRMQRAKLGTLVIYMAAGLTLMVLIPNPLWGRLLFLACAASVFAVGWLEEECQARHAALK